jgi:hypothetical protein
VDQLALLVRIAERAVVRDHEDLGVGIALPIESGRRSTSAGSR